MVCYHPLDAWRSTKDVTSKGTAKIVFSHVDSAFLKPDLQLPCGQCVGCRLARSASWAVRCVHEASLYDSNCFITLTFKEEYLPPDMSLDVRYFQLFMKRLRKRFGVGIRFYHCGEYGEKYGRPHYHACLFNFDFPDKVYWRKSKTGYPIYRSEILEELWPYGLSEIGTVTFESAAYVARYIMKKVNGDAADMHYERYDVNTGEVFWLKPEYTTMSRRPGIAKDWYDKFKSDVFPDDFLVVDGRKVSVPRFYSDQYELTNPEEFATIKKLRIRNAKLHKDNNTPERLAVRETVKLAALENLVRDLD